MGKKPCKPTPKAEQIAILKEALAASEKVRESLKQNNAFLNEEISSRLAALQRDMNILISRMLIRKPTLLERLIHLFPWT